MMRSWCSGVTTTVQKSAFVSANARAGVGVAALAARRRAHRGRTRAPAGSTSTSAATLDRAVGDVALQEFAAPALAEHADADVDDPLRHLTRTRHRLGERRPLQRLGVPLGKARPARRILRLRNAQRQVAERAADADEPEVEVAAERRRPRAPGYRAPRSTLPSCHAIHSARLLRRGTQPVRCGRGWPRPGCRRRARRASACASAARPHAGSSRRPPNSASRYSQITGESYSTRAVVEDQRGDLAERIPRHDLLRLLARLDRRQASMRSAMPTSCATTITLRT